MIGLKKKLNSNPYHGQEQQDNLKKLATNLMQGIGENKTTTNEQSQAEIKGLTSKLVEKDQ